MQFSSLLTSEVCDHRGEHEGERRQRQRDHLPAAVEAAAPPTEQKLLPVKENILRKHASHYTRMSSYRSVIETDDLREKNFSPRNCLSMCVVAKSFQRSRDRDS